MKMDAPAKLDGLTGRLSNWSTILKTSSRRDVEGQASPGLAYYQAYLFGVSFELRMVRRTI